jgi:hypothetical protein
MKVFITTVIGTINFCCLVVLGLNHQQAQSTEKHITCSYSPKSGKPNPLGMRTFITAIEENGNSTFVYEQFPSVVSANKPITVEVKRTMIFYDTDIKEARATLRENYDYYSELVGYPDSEGFTLVDEVLECK